MMKTSKFWAAVTPLYALMNYYVLKIRFSRCYLPLMSGRQTVGQLECWNQLQEALHMESHCCSITSYITTGQIPKALKVSSAFPVPKGFEVISVSNYRLTSLLPVVSKLSAVSALIDVLHVSLVIGTWPKKRGLQRSLLLYPSIQLCAPQAWISSWLNGVFNCFRQTSRAKFCTDSRELMSLIR